MNKVNKKIDDTVEFSQIKDNMLKDINATKREISDSSISFPDFDMFDILEMLEDAKENAHIEILRKIGIINAEGNISERYSEILSKVQLETSKTDLVNNSFIGHYTVTTINEAKRTLYEALVNKHKDCITEEEDDILILLKNDILDA